MGGRISRIPCPGGGAGSCGLPVFVPAQSSSPLDTTVKVGANETTGHDSSFTLSLDGVECQVVRYPYVHLVLGEYCTSKVDVQNVYAVPQFHGGMTGHVIASALNVAQTSHSYGDFMLLARAAESKQENPSLYMVEMAWVQSNLHLRALEAIEFLEIFLSMNPDSSGHVEFHDFLRALKLKPCGLLKSDVDTKAHILKQPLFHHACELAFSECDIKRKELHFEARVSLTVPNVNYDEIHGLFSLFDMDNDGKISKDDFVSCLRRCPLLIALFAPKLLQRSSSIATQSLVEEERSKYYLEFAFEGIPSVERSFIV
ncbi:Lysophospholipid acyltransferase LPEAT2 [Sesamum angolense]|uniref:Lysophospholipid acyltransferase LPEAT2 n=1 Tax=Sesamum angolense TaxID=2727404 RepID=A0AAE2C7B1_9LAMI|nr:Lysophospholipid acyltransferase LPEAT2 [Sesamum angolense]